MTKFYLLMIVVTIAGCFTGYEVASRDLLQQVFLARKLTHRLAECLCTALILLLQMFFSPSILLCIIPPVVVVLYILGVWAIQLLFRRKESKACTDDYRRKTLETALCTLISSLVFVGLGFLVCQAIAYSPNWVAQLHIVVVDQTICCGMTMGANALLLVALVHYLLVLRMYPSDDDNPSRELMRLRKELRVPHRI